MTDLTTSRLTLRPFGPSDGELLHRLMSDPKVFFWLKTPPTRADAEVLLASKLACTRGCPGWYPVFLKAEDGGQGEFVGQTCIQPLPSTEFNEIGYHFLPQAWGNGYATEAAGALMQHYFEATSFDALHGVVLPDNQPSLGVMKRLGLKDIGSRPHGRDGWVHRLFAISRPEFETKMSLDATAARPAPLARPAGD